MLSNLKGNPLGMGVKYPGGVEKFAISTEIAIYLGMVRDKPMVAMER